MDTAHAQLRRILQLALHSPYEGERSKAVSLLLQKLEREKLTLADIDPSFTSQDTANELRFRANLPYVFEVTLKSHEEALFYEGLLARYPDTSSEWLEGHRLQCKAFPNVKLEIDHLLAVNLVSLQHRLAVAQKQAMAEYHARRKQLFAQAVTEELFRIATPPREMQGLPHE